MPAENDSSSTALYTLWASPLLVISLYNYNFCGYERGLAAHFSYLSPTAEAGHRIASSSLIADIIGFYSGTSLSLYLMHTYIRVFEPRRRYFFPYWQIQKKESVVMTLFFLDTEWILASSGKNEERRSLLDFGLVSKSLEML